MYRWGPGNRTKARTEPAPSELLKATGMQPITSRAEPVTSDISRCWGGDKSVGDLWRHYLAGILSCVFAHGYFYACHPLPLTKHLEHRGLMFCAEIIDFRATLAESRFSHDALRGFIVGVIAEVHGGK